MFAVERAGDLSPLLGLGVHWRTELSAHALGYRLTALRAWGGAMGSGELPWWNPTGNPESAQGGSGDVLVGFLGGLLAQPALVAEAMRAIRGAVFHHGSAADRLEALGEPWDAADLSRTIRWG